MNTEYVTCYGYCCLNPIASVYKSKLPSVEKSTIFMESFEAKQKGWVKVSWFRYSPVKGSVWLCPKCAKRWREEKGEYITHLIECKKELHKMYINTEDSETRKKIIGKDLHNLRAEFERWKPDTQQWKEWNNA